VTTQYKPLLEGKRGNATDRFTANVKKEGQRKIGKTHLAGRGREGQMIGDKPSIPTEKEKLDTGGKPFAGGERGVRRCGYMGSTKR